MNTTILLFTQNYTQAEMKELIEQIIEKVPNCNCEELLKIFNEHESKCLAKLEKRESHVEKESIVDFSKEPTALQEIRTDKRKLEFQDERPSKIRKTKFPFYEPMDYEFATLAGLIFYFLDYSNLIHDAFPNLQLKTNKCDNFCFTCEFCQDAAHNL